MENQEQLDYLEGLLSSQKFMVESIACREAERQYEELKAQNEVDASETVATKSGSDKAMPKSTLACEIANVREKINSFLKYGDVVSSEVCCENLNERIKVYEQQNEYFKTALARTNETLNALTQKFEAVTDMLSKLPFTIEVQPNGEIVYAPKSKPSKQIILTTPVKPREPPMREGVPGVPHMVEVKTLKLDDEGDDIDLFGSDDETEEEAKLRADRLKAYETKKSKKPALVAKSSVVLDVKPWDDETDMKELEAAVRKVETDGLKWGAGKLVPLAYGIQKFQIVAIVEDEKVSIDWLQETIQEIDDLVQSVDIAAFNKL